MSEVLITGSNGTIGSVLRGLDYKIRPFDLPECNTLNHNQLKERMVGCAAVVHLAWNTKDDNYGSELTDPNNYAMAQNVYNAARETGVRRVIVASSIHADMPQQGVEPEASRSPYELPFPDGPYGASKVAVEALGRYFTASKGLEIVCVRFGWVSPNAEARPDPNKPYPIGEGWISHRDCIDVVSASIAAEQIPHNYQIIWGLSRRNSGGWHDLSKQIWQPKDSYDAPLT